MLMFFLVFAGVYDVYPGYLREHMYSPRCTTCVAGLSSREPRCEGTLSRWYLAGRIGILPSFVEPISDASDVATTHLDSSNHLTDSYALGVCNRTEDKLCFILIHPSRP